MLIMLSADSFHRKGERKTAASIFDDKTAVPNDEMVDAALSGTSGLWNECKLHVAENYHNTGQEWKYYSRKAGWSLVFRQGKRTLFYFIPCSGYFMVAFVLGEKAEKAAERSSLPEHIRQRIASAVPYAEGKSFFVDVKDESDLESVFTLLRIKEGS